METFVTLAFLFCIGAMMGWGLEVLFRKFFSGANPEHKWINPGFCQGPWLPLYGFGLIGLYGIALIAESITTQTGWLYYVILFSVMALIMTIIEFIAGEFCMRILHVMLWDYSECWGNIDKVICPRFTMYWGILGVFYYLVMHPHIESWVQWLMGNPLFTFFIGLFYGVFIVDVCYSANVIAKLKKMADDYEIIVQIERIRIGWANLKNERQEKNHFFLPNFSVDNLRERIAEYAEQSEENYHQFKERFKISNQKKKKEKNA